MESRKYSVQEIDELRQALKDRYLYGTSVISDVKNRMSRQYHGNEMEVIVEERLRTHMVAGHVALDIYEADKIQGR